MIEQRHHFPDVLAYHFSGNGIQGGVPHRLIPAGFGDAAHALAAVYNYSGLVREGNRGVDQRAVGDVGVVARVLSDGAGNGAAGCFDILDHEIEGDAFGRFQSDAFFAPARQKHPGRRLGRSRRAGTGGITEPQLFAVLFDELLHLAIW